MPPLLAGALRKLDSRRIRPALATQIGAWGAALVVVLYAGAMLPNARKQLRLERSDLKHERARTVEIGRLSAVVKKLGPAHILACGQPNIPIEYQSVLAWYMGVKTGILYVSPGYFKAHPHPLVNIYPINGGWKVFPSHVTPADAPHCQGLVLFTPPEPAWGRPGPRPIGPRARRRGALTAAVRPSACGWRWRRR